MKPIISLLHYAWGILLILASYPLVNMAFDPSTNGPGYDFVWELALGSAPLLVCLLMLAKQAAIPGARPIAGLTYLAAAAYSGFAIWTDTEGLMDPTGSGATFHLFFMGSSVLAIIVAVWLYVFRGSTKARNFALLWLLRQDWYQEVMDRRIRMSADGMHGLNWLMEAPYARKTFPDEFGMLLGVPNSPESLVIAWGKVIYGRLIVGGDRPRRVAPGCPIYYPLNKGMTVLLGPSRTGKFTSYNGNNLLNWKSGGSKGNPNVVAPFITMDPKGENFVMTAVPRMKKGRRAIAVDPLNVLGTGCYAHDNAVAKETGDYVATHRWRCNAFDFINPHPTYFESSLAAIINPLFPMPKSGGGDDDFWNDDGKSKMGGVAAWVADCDTWWDSTPFPSEKRNLATILDLLSLDPTELKIWVDFMAQGAGKSIRGFKEVAQGISKRIGSQMLTTIESEKQWSGLVSTITTKLKWVDQSMRECMERSGCSHGTTVGKGGSAYFTEIPSKFESFDFATLWDGKTDVYFIVPDDRLKDLGPWLRMMVCAVASVIKNNVHQTLGRQFVFLLDELAQVGGISELKEMSAYAAGKGIHVVMIFQTLSQMKEQYGQDGYNTLMGNAYAKILLGAADLDTGKMLGDHIGKTTAIVDQVSSSGQMGTMGANISTSTQTGAVDVLSLQSILGTSPHQGYAIVSQQKSVLLYDKIYYYEKVKVPDRKGVESYLYCDEDGNPIYPEPNPFDLARIREWQDKQHP